MPKFPRPTGPQLVRFLERLGFQVVRQRGSHVRMRHPDGRVTTVPVHGRRRLPIGLVRALVRDDLDLARDEFLRLWDEHGP